MKKAFKYRLYPTRAQVEQLDWTLTHCWELYNAALQERKEAWKYAHHSVSYYDQANDLPEIKREIRPEYQQIGSHVLQEVLRRVEKTFNAFFRRVKAGQTPGYPRYRSRTRYDSFTFPDSSGWKLNGNRLSITSLGTIKVKMHRPVEGTIKTVSIKREGTCWYVVFTCEVVALPLPISYEEVGIDLGVTHFAALSDGTTIEQPRFTRLAEKKLTSAQQSLARKKRGSKRRKKAVQRVARCHRTVRNQRRDFQHKASRHLVTRYQLIAFEGLQTKNLVRRPQPKQDETGAYLPNGAAAKSGLNKSIHEAGWRQFVEMVSVKAASAGRTVVFVDPHKTSQICSGCKREGPHKDLSERTHQCPHCGLVLDRDHNAALNILRLGRSHQDAHAS